MFPLLLPVLGVSETLLIIRRMSWRSVISSPWSIRCALLAYGGYLLWIGYATQGLRESAIKRFGASNFSPWIVVLAMLPGFFILILAIGLSKQTLVGKWNRLLEAAAIAMIVTMLFTVVVYSDYDRPGYRHGSDRRDSLTPTPVPLPSANTQQGSPTAESLRPPTAQ